jgi:hypothetical protein
MSAGKGDSPRPVNAEVYGQNYEDIFRKQDVPQEINNRPQDGRICNCEDAPCCGCYNLS